MSSASPSPRHQHDLRPRPHAALAHLLLQRSRHQATDARDGHRFLCCCSDGRAEALPRSAIWLRLNWLSDSAKVEFNSTVTGPIQWWKARFDGVPLTDGALSLRELYGLECLRCHIQRSMSAFVAG